MTAHYLHLPGVGTGPLFPRLAAAVAPGGTLLIVGHLLDAADGHGHDHRGHDHDHRGHGHDHGGHAHDHGGHGHDHRGHAHDHGGHAHDPDMFFTAEDIAASLEAGEWTDVVTETRERASAAIERTGNPAPDTVLRARRRASGAR